MWHTHTDTQTDRHTETDRQTHIHTERQTDTHTHTHTLTGRQTDTHTHTQTHTYTQRQTHTHKHTDRQTDTHTHTPTTLLSQAPPFTLTVLSDICVAVGWSCTLLLFVYLTATPMQRACLPTYVPSCFCREHYHADQVIPRELIAFSDPSPSGRKFAERYIGMQHFLVYQWFS